MALWTENRIIDDQFSIKECIDELYEFDEAKSVSIDDLHENMKVINTAARSKFGMIDHRLKIMNYSALVFVAMTLAGFMLIYLK